MDKYKIRLDIFEGPLALLLHLLEKNQLDIYDIPITLVTEQYLTYLNKMRDFDIEIASEFLLMAATLLQIKSRMLLPRPPKLEIDEAEAIDPRQELVERLLEYKKYKMAAQCLETMRLRRTSFFTRTPQPLLTSIPLPSDLTIEDLLQAFSGLYSDTQAVFALIKHDEISLQDKINDILTLLTARQEKMEFFETIIRSKSRVEVVTAFIAVLELMRMKRIIVNQEQRFGPIFLILRDGDCGDVLPAS